VRLGRAVAVALLLLTAACAPDNTEMSSAPLTKTASLAPLLESDAIIADDGARLPLVSWLPSGRPKAVVLYIHGFNDYSHGGEAPGKILASDGIAAYAYDQRGFGRAPERGHWAGTQRLAQDLAEASRLLRARHPGLPLYLLGESMGGALVVAAVTGVSGAEKPVQDGIILMAPAVWGRSYLNIFERGALALAYAFVPNMTFTGQSLHIMASDNIEMLRELARDPLFIKATRVDAIKGLVDLMDLAYAAGPLLTEKTLLLYGAHDELIPVEPVKGFIRSLPAVPPGRRTIAWYQAGYHMLSRDLEGATVIGDIESWIEHPAAPLPSGADRNVLEVPDSESRWR